jgi:uncharacterized peroxidase-related enzyme
MSWIKTIDFAEASDALKKIYKRVTGPNNNVDNVLKIHSLRPHTLVGHMALYKNVLHNSNNTLPKWYLESLGTYVSHLNQCNYCVEHHAEGLKRLLDNDEKYSEIRANIKSDQLEKSFDEKMLEGFRYAKKLTLAHHTIFQKDIEALRSVGYDDGEVLEINQLVSYFNYVNRTVVGLGVNTDGDILGLSPNESDDPNNWSHN